MRPRFNYLNTEGVSVQIIEENSGFILINNNKALAEM